MSSSTTDDDDRSKQLCNQQSSCRVFALEYLCDGAMYVPFTPVQLEMCIALASVELVLAVLLYQKDNTVDRTKLLSKSSKVSALSLADKLGDLFMCKKENC